MTLPLSAAAGASAAFIMFPFPFLHRNETGMGPEGHVSNHNLSTIMLRLLFQCCVAILCKDNLTWCVWGALSLMWCLRCSKTAKNSLGGALKDLPSTQALTWRLVSRYPRGTDLGEMCQLPGSNECDSQEGREKEKLARAPA